MRRLLRPLERPLPHPPLYAIRTMVVVVRFLLSFYTITLGIAYLSSVRIAGVSPFCQGQKVLPHKPTYRTHIIFRCQLVLSTTPRRNILLNIGFSISGTGLFRLEHPPESPDKGLRLRSVTAQKETSRTLQQHKYAVSQSLQVGRPSTLYEQTQVYRLVL